MAENSDIVLLSNERCQYLHFHTLASHLANL